MKFRRFSAFFLVGFFVLLTAILFSSKPVSSDWTNDLEEPTGTVQVQCPGQAPIPLSSTGTTNIPCSARVEVIPGCSDNLSGCSSLQYAIDTTNPNSYTKSVVSDCKTPVNSITIPEPYPTIGYDAGTHTISLKDVYDCAGNHTTSTKEFRFRFGQGSTPTLPPPTIPPTIPPSSPTPTNTPVPSPTIIPGTWFQGVGGDMRQDSGFTDSIPTVSPTPLYASIQSLTAPIQSLSPGVIYSGVGSNFGGGKPSTKEWLVINSPYSATLGRNTSYASLNGVLSKYGISKKSLDSYNCTGVGTGCDLQSIFAANGSGAYATSTPADIYIIASNTPIPSGSYVILADGNVTVIGDIKLDSGAFLLISSNKNIIIEDDVTVMAGFYSADQNFTVNPAVASPQQLVIEGFVAANAGGGSNYFSNQRQLAVQTTPSVRIIERPDMILRYPEYLKKPNYIWQEVAP